MVSPLAHVSTGRYPFFLLFLLSTTLFYSYLHHVQLTTLIDPSIDRSIHFDLTAGDDVDNTMRRLWDPGIRSTSAESRLSTSNHIDRSTAPSTQLRRQWDPGIAKDGIDHSFHLPTSHSNVVVIDRPFNFLPRSHSNVVVVTMVRTNRLMRQVPCMLSPVELLRSMELPADAQLDPMSELDRVDRIELNLRALPTTPHAEAMLTPSLATYNPNLLFHYSHPVLRHLWDPTAVRMTTVRRGALALIHSLFQYSHPVLSRPTVPNIQ